MPSFDDETTTTAPVEEVWKLLYDPARIPDWWQGVETVDTAPHDGRGDFTLFPAGHPDFPMPQELRTDHAGHRVTISCLVNELVFAWRLEPLPGEEGTRIGVHVEIPEQEARRLGSQRDAIGASLRALARLAAAATDAPRARG